MKEINNSDRKPTKEMITDIKRIISKKSPRIHGDWKPRINNIKISSLLQEDWHN